MPAEDKIIIDAGFQISANPIRIFARNFGDCGVELEDSIIPLTRLNGDRSGSIIFDISLRSSAANEGIVPILSTHQIAPKTAAQSVVTFATGKRVPPVVAGEDVPRIVSCSLEMPTAAKFDIFHRGEGAVINQ